MAEGPFLDLGIEGITNAQHIGSGGAADVYKAEQPRLGRTVAVKVLRANTSADSRSRFEREAQTLGRLSNHPGIVTLHEAGLTGIGQPFLMMEFCEAGTLADRAALEGTIGWQETCRIVADIAEVVDEAHQAGVLHRDLKPANVLIDSRGKHLVADFGVAALSDTGNFSAAADFTPGYAPPETLRGEAATPAGDVYSLGATAHALITGRVPFEATDSESNNVLAWIRRIETEPPEDLRPFGVPEAVAAVIERTMSKDPTERPSASEFTEQLSAAATGRPIPGIALGNTPPMPPSGNPATTAVSAVLPQKPTTTQPPMPGAGPPMPGVPTNVVTGPTPGTSPNPDSLPTDLSGHTTAVPQLLPQKPTSMEVPGIGGSPGLMPPIPGQPTPTGPVPPMPTGPSTGPTPSNPVTGPTPGTPPPGAPATPNPPLNTATRPSTGRVTGPGPGLVTGPADFPVATGPSITPPVATPAVPTQPDSGPIPPIPTGPITGTTPVGTGPVPPQSFTPTTGPLPTAPGAPATGPVPVAGPHTGGFPAPAQPVTTSLPSTPIVPPTGSLPVQESSGNGRNKALLVGLGVAAVVAIGGIAVVAMNLGGNDQNSAASTTVTTADSTTTASSTTTTTASTTTTIAPPVSALIAAETTNDSIVLVGSVPDQATSDALVAAAAVVFSEDQIDASLLVVDPTVETVEITLTGEMADPGRKIELEKALREVIGVVVNADQLDIVTTTTVATTPVTRRPTTTRRATTAAPTTTRPPLGTPITQKPLG